MPVTPTDDPERRDIHDRPYDCVYCHQRVVSQADQSGHADDCLRHFEGEMLPDPDDIHLTEGP